jgi:tetratricopeptide (TPR) repeat protein
MMCDRELSSVVRLLDAALISRDTQTGFATMRTWLKDISLLDRRDKYFIPFLFYAVQWVDLGLPPSPALGARIDEVSATDLSRLSVIEFLMLRLIWAFQAVIREDLDEAIALIEGCLSVGSAILPAHMLFVANFWKGRAHRKRGEYELASIHITAARQIAEQNNTPKLVAVTKIHESWLVFQKGDRSHAFRLLDEAEQQLRETGHALSLGNIESARGRFVRRSGQYTVALKHFESAIAIYSSNGVTHPNVARALVNAAYVKRLIALNMRQAMVRGQARGSAHERYLKISHEALALLDQAASIYIQENRMGGLGSVLVNAGHIHLESGDIERASEEARKAYLLAEGKRDQILMARARILQCAIELTRSEEQLGDGPDPPVSAQLAVEHAQEAIDLATHTQNRRLLAEAYIVRGLAATDDCFQDWESAKDFASRAAEFLADDDRDHLYWEFSKLKRRILHSAEIDETLRNWSQGQLGSKTFQQAQEEFAELVIPKVWMSLGCNITRVAEKLSISPKKVRRILRNAKHLDEHLG